MDLGAGDGWWTEKFSKFVGESGAVHAAEVAEKKVEQMTKRIVIVPKYRFYGIRNLVERRCVFEVLGFTVPLLSRAFAASLARAVPTPARECPSGMDSRLSNSRVGLATVIGRR